jgi:hypothetical protein
LRVVIGFLLLLLPGALAFRFFLPDGHPVAESLGMVPALSVLALSLVGMVLVAVIRTPFDAPLAMATLVMTTLSCAGLHMLGRRRPRPV